MNKEKGFCEVCGTEIEVNMCCSGHMCGCYGLPTERLYVVMNVTILL